VWAFEKGFVEPAGQYSHVDRQSYFQYADSQKRRYASPRRPVFIATLWPRPVGCFSALLAPYVSIQDTLVVTAGPARTALKNSQLTYGETYAYFGDRTLTCNKVVVGFRMIIAGQD
jgi:hypothetical protein